MLMAALMVADELSGTLDRLSKVEEEVKDIRGSRDEIAHVADLYKVYVRRGEETGDGHYLVDHSSFTYLMGPDGEFVALFRQGYDPQGLAGSNPGEIMDVGCGFEDGPGRKPVFGQNLSKHLAAGDGVLHPRRLWWCFDGGLDGAAVCGPGLDQFVCDL